MPSINHNESFATATAVAKLAVNELLRGRIEWDKVVQAVLKQVEKFSEPLEIVSLESSAPIQDIMQSVEDQTPSYKLSINAILQSVFGLDPAKLEPDGARNCTIAIVGMSCRLPGGAVNTEHFWQILQSGMDTSSRVPAGRFDIETRYDCTVKSVNKSHTPYGAFIDQPGLFDAAFFNMSPRKAQQTDPMQRLALTTRLWSLPGLF